MAPMALVGPAVSGFSTASIAQSAFTTTANYMLKKSTGKTLTQHAFDAVSNDILKQSYLPRKNQKLIKETKQSNIK